MYELPRKVFLILSFAVATAQFFDDLQADYGGGNAAYSDGNGAYDDGNGVYSDNNEAYGDGIGADGDDYGGYGDKYSEDDTDYGYLDGDYETEDLGNIAFPMDKFKEFYNCLCMGTSKECRILYSIEDLTLTVDLIEKNGTFHGESNLCKYYSCLHIAGSKQITCHQIEQRTSACNAGVAAQFFRLKNHDCCGSTCVGLIWSSLDEQMSFMQNSSDVENCGAKCLCPTQGEGAPNITKITSSTLSNETQIDKYIIHKIKTSSVVLTSSDRTTVASSQKMWNVSTEVSDNGVLINVNQNKPPPATNGNSSSLDKVPSFHANEKAKKEVIMAVVITIGIAFIILCCVIVIIVVVRRRKRRIMKQNVNNNTTSEAGSGANFNHVPELSYANSVKVNESTLANDSTIVPGNVDTVYEQSPFSIMYRNGVRDLDSNDVGSDSSNILPKTVVHTKAGPPSKLKNGRSSNIANAKHRDVDKGRLHSSSSETDGLIADRSSTDKRGQFIKAPDGRNVTRAQIGDDLESKQPLLSLPEIKESIV